MDTISLNQLRGRLIFLEVSSGCFKLDLAAEEECGAAGRRLVMRGKDQVSPEKSLTVSDINHPPSIKMFCKHIKLLKRSSQ